MKKDDIMQSPFSTGSDPGVKPKRNNISSYVNEGNNNNDSTHFDINGSFVSATSPERTRLNLGSYVQSKKNSLRQLFKNKNAKKSMTGDI